MSRRQRSDQSFGDWLTNGPPQKSNRPPKRKFKSKKAKRRAERLGKVYKSKGTLYRCDDCGNTVRLKTSQLFKATRPKCLNCGCTRLLPATENSAQAEVRRNTAVAKLAGRKHIARGHN